MWMHNFLYLLCNLPIIVHGVLLLYWFFFENISPSMPHSTIGCVISCFLSLMNIFQVKFVSKLVTPGFTTVREINFLLGLHLFVSFFVLHF